MNKLSKKMLGILIPLISVLIYICHSFVLRNHYANIFSSEVSSALNKNLALGFAFIFGCVFYSILLFLAFRLLDLVKNKEAFKLNHPLFLSYLKEFCICFLPLFILLLLTWPGIFKGDEFYVLKAIRTYDFSSAQTGLTSMFFIACLRFFPSMAAIPFFQIIIISGIYSYIFVGLTKHYKIKWLWLCRIICLLLPILDGCLFTLRATLVGWIFLLVMCMCLFTYKDVKKENTYSKATIITILILSGLVIAWRSEFIYLLILLPLFLCINLYKEKVGIKKMLLTFIICMASIFISFQVFNIPNKIALKGQNKYPISLVIGPLGNIFAQEEIRGEHAYEDIEVLSELLDVQALKRHPSFRNISQYWNIDDILPEDQLNRFMNASYDLILNNFDHFLYYKWKTFQYTNGMVKNDINHPVAPSLNTIYTLIYYDEDYHLSYYFMNPIFGNNVRNSVIDFLTCRHYDNENPTTNFLYPILYNCLPTFFIALGLMIICIIKKKWAMAFLLFTTGCQIVLIFLTAPAMFFMYYFCFYLAGYFLSAVSTLR